MSELNREKLARLQMQVDRVNSDNELTSAARAFTQQKDLAEFIKLKPSVGALVNKQDAKGNTPLHWAADRPFGQRFLEPLLSIPGVDPMIKNSRGQTFFEIFFLAPLHIGAVTYTQRDVDQLVWLRDKAVRENKKEARRGRKEARELTSAEQTILRAPAQLGDEGLAPKDSALAKAMSTGILQSQVGKFLTSKPIKGDTIKPAIRELRRDITGKGRGKRLSTRRKSKRNVRTGIRYSRRRT